MYKIAKVKNGNYFYTIYSDGTKFRQEVPNPKPLFPESMDVKITNYCDMGCPYCHENSSLKGEHGDILSSLDYWDGVGGQEIALGGGNPISHPDLTDFLIEMKKRKKICNITVNSGHIKKVEKKLKKLISRGLIYGVGVSYGSPDVRIDIPNTVWHFIIGVHNFLEVNEFLSRLDKPKVLLLGYKNVGRGKLYKPSGIEDWKGYENLNADVVSLDNLAIEQLDIDVNDPKIKDCFLGDDGEFSMYVDLVEGEFSVSSASEKRFAMDSCLNDFRFLKSA